MGFDAFTIVYVHLTSQDTATQFDALIGNWLHRGYFLLLPALRLYMAPPLTHINQSDVLDEVTIDLLLNHRALGELSDDNQSINRSWFTTWLT